MPGQIYVISGPSGAGKSTIIQVLMKRVPDLGYSVSHTTRRARGSEKEGAEYRFVDRRTFEGMIQDEAFVEWAEVYGDLYGTSIAGLREKLDRGLDVILDVDSQGARNMEKHFKEDCTLIYLLPPSLEVLEARLKGRGTDEPGVIEARLEKAVRELKACLDYHYLVINDDLDTATGQVEAIIVSNRCRRSRMLSAVNARFDIAEGG
jgi:guanylate kinase